MNEKERMQMDEWIKGLDANKEWMRSNMKGKNGKKWRGNISNKGKGRMNENE